ncbi:glycerate kinase [Kurthia massiliensis]|uniref:glycerate kinase n=1 Tax=Kurthia massiliensis TaxID=1033739 RepID=UPI00028A38E3|nr:glycerate kinase [Kurthia massiliensis]
MKIIVSPDSFKGSLDATMVAQTIQRAIQATKPSFHVQTLPVADGGEGTLESLVQATNGQLIHLSVHDPLERMIDTYYGVLGNGLYVIEMAKASGLPLIEKSLRNPLISTTYGTGECIRHALDRGARQFMIGIGGSATNDGGLGMLRALGMKFYTANEKEIIVPKDLHKLAHIDDTQFDSRIQQCTFTIACDVDNPFIGPSGASAVFGPQKGATPEMVKTLDRHLTHFADVIARTGRIALHDVAGAGAAGGLGGAFLAFFPATLQSGIDVVLDAIQFDDALQGADVVITGEGKSDAQTLSGKAPVGILHRAKKLNIKTVLLSAIIEDYEQLAKVFDHMYAIVDGDVTAQMSLMEPEKYLYNKVVEIVDDL